MNTKKGVYSVSDTGGSEEKIRVLPMGVESMTLLFTSPDALPLSYRTLMGAKATKLQKVHVTNMNRISTYFFS